MTEKHTNIEGIILAAGKSSRMGKIKQLLPYNGNTILGQVVSNCLRSSLEKIIIVLGYKADQIQQSVNLDGVTVIVNKDYFKGLSSSIRAGLSNISQNCDGVLFILGDQPLVDEIVIDMLIKGFYESRAPIVVPVYKGKRGNPVLIGRSLFHELKKNLKEDMGARILIDKFRNQVKKINMTNAGINIDVDTLDDYHKLLSLLDSGVSR